MVQIIQNVPVNDVLIQRKSYPFRQVLSRAFINCPVAQPILVKAELKESQLVAIFSRYKSCAPGRAAVAGTARKTKVHFGAVVGAQSATTTLGDDGNVALRSGLRPVVGVGMLSNPASFNEKLALRIELLSRMQVHEADYQRKYRVSSSLESNRKANITRKTLRVPLMLRYALPRGMVRPYLQVGGEVSTRLDLQQAFMVGTNQKQGSVGTTREIEMRSFGFGGTGALEVFIPAGPGAFQRESIHKQLDSSSYVVDLVGGAQTISFLLGYNFGR